MHDHDLDVDHTTPDVATPETETGGLDRAVQGALASGRPDALGTAGVSSLQRAAGNAGVQALMREEDAGAKVNGVLGGSGKPLDDDTRGFMEDRIGSDFSSVRIHDDSAASDSAEAVAANAYTVGEDVVFRSGQYDPGSEDGQRTLAHELTHVVQQRQGPVEGTDTGAGYKVSDPSDRFEREAEATADAVMRTPAEPAATSTAAAASTSGPSMQREGMDEEEELQTLPMQREDMPEEEEMQMLQREDMPEEEEMQMLQRHEEDAAS